MNFGDYFRSLTKDGTGDSSKSFALVLSAIVGAFIAVIIGVVLLVDVISDGVVTTDMMDLGFLLISDGVFMIGGATSKTLVDRIEMTKKKKKVTTETDNDEGYNKITTEEEVDD